MTQDYKDWDVQLEYFKRNNKNKEAIRFLETLLKIDKFKSNYVLWWELARLYDTPREKRRAASQTLRHNPGFRPAYNMLTALIPVEEPSIPKPPPRNDLHSTTLIITVLMIILGTFIVLILVYENPVVSNFITVQGARISNFWTTLPIAEPSPTATVALITETPIPISTNTPVAITPTDTPVTSPPIVTEVTSEPNPTMEISVSTTPFSVALAETINPRWLGTTTGVARIYEAPILIYINITSDEETWRPIIHEAIAEIAQILPIAETTVFNDAHIIVRIVSETDYISWSGCPIPEVTAGCGWIVANTISSTNDNSKPPDYRGYVWLSKGTPNPVGSLIHEMLHALGINSHSTNPDDIMYQRVTERSTLSDNDIQWIKDLYGIP